MAIKIGKWYITRNNPRELLLQLRYKQDIIDEFTKYCEECYEDNGDCTDYPYSYLNELQKIKEKYDERQIITNCFTLWNI